MCLQDIKLSQIRESYQGTGSVGAAAGTGTNIEKSVARRRLWITTFGDFALLNGNLVYIYNIDTRPAFPIATLSSGSPFALLRYEDWGDLIYGPISIVDVTSNMTIFYYWEQRANQNEESVA